MPQKKKDRIPTRICEVCGKPIEYYSYVRTSGRMGWESESHYLKRRFCSPACRFENDKRIGMQNKGKIPTIPINPAPSEVDGWKNIKGFVGLYQIHNSGIVRSLDRKVWNRNGYKLESGKILKPNILAKGYFQVYLTNAGITKCLQVHRLVAEAFIPNPQNLPQVNHKDENKSNNRVDNLEWCTQEYNTNYGTCTQRISNAHKALQKGKRVVQIDKCSQTIIATYPNSAIAMEQTGIDASAIKKVCLNRPKFKTAGGYIWRHADDIPDQPENNNSYPKQQTLFDL